MLLRSIIACSLATLACAFACDDAADTVRELPDTGTPGPSASVNPVFNTPEIPGDVVMSPPTSEDADAFKQAKLIMRGMNIGNYLDQPGQPTDPSQPQCPTTPPTEGQGAGGGKVRGWMFEAIKQAGFDHVRLTVNWNCHTHATDDSNPYQIDEDWLARVDWAVAHALSRGLAIIVDMHNYWDYFDGRPNERDKFISMWTQLAEHYKDYPKELFFELLNEPPYRFDDATLGNDLRDVIAAIRVTNPYRSIIYGGTNFNKTAELGRLTQIPAEDKNLIGTIHYYSPYCFTHAQAWDCPSGHSDASTAGWPILFPSDYADDVAAAAAADASLKKIESDFDAAVAMSQQIGRPIYNGEFGAMQTRSIGSRAAYIAAVARASEKRGIGWANWGLINVQFDAWKSNIDWYPEIIQALFPGYGAATH